MQIEDAVTVVRSFLTTYYHDRSSSDVAAADALEAQTGGPERYRTARALRLVLDSVLPSGTLADLVMTAANRQVDDDRAARDFLEMVFYDNAFEVAWDLDEDTY